MLYLNLQALLLSFLTPPAAVARASVPGRGAWLLAPAPLYLTLRSLPLKFLALPWLQRWQELVRYAEQRGCLHQPTAMQDLQKTVKRCMVEAKRLECFGQGGHSLFDGCAWQVGSHSLFEGCAWQVSRDLVCTC